MEQKQEIEARALIQKQMIAEKLVSLVHRIEPFLARRTTELMLEMVSLPESCNERMAHSQVSFFV